MPVTITPIGSCRITNPLREAAHRFDFTLNMDGVYGYTHSSAEALQQLKYFQGEFAPSEFLRPILCGQAVKVKSELGLRSKKSDLYLVELSAAKVLFVGSEYVQSNYVSVFFADFFSDAVRARKFWSLSKMGGDKSNEKENFLKSEAVFQKMSSEKQRLLRDLTYRLCSEEELKSDMLEISKRVDNVVFITHCNGRSPDGSLLKSRSEWIELVKKVGLATGLAVFDPTELMERMGQSKAFEKEGLDLTHYTPSFERALFDEWNSRYIASLSESGALIAKSASVDAEKAKTKFNDPLVGLGHGSDFETLRELFSALRREPMQPDLNVQLSQALFAIGDYEGVVRRLASFRETCDLNDDALQILMLSYFEIEDWDNSLEIASLLLSQERDSADVFRVCAVVAEIHGDFAQAMIYWKRVFDLADSYLFEAMSALARLNESTGDLDKAIFWTKELIKANSDDDAFVAQLYRLQAESFDEDQLSQLLKDLVSVPPALILGLIGIAKKRQMFMGAARGLVELRARFPLDRSIRTFVEETLIAWDADIDSVETLDSLSSAKKLKAILILQPRNNKALRAWRVLVNQKRDNLKAAFKEKQYDVVIELGVFLRRIGSDFVGVNFLVGRACFELGMHQQSLPWFVLATAEDGVNVSAWVFRARAAVKSEVFVEALTCYRHLLDMAGDSDSNIVEEAESNIDAMPMRAIKMARKLCDEAQYDDAWDLTQFVLAEDQDNAFAVKLQDKILRALRDDLLAVGEDDLGTRVQLARSIYSKDASNAFAIKVLAVELMRRKDYKGALKHWKELFVISPEVVSVKNQILKCEKLLSGQN